MTFFPPPGDNEMFQLVCYDHPRDLPDHFVVRAWYVHEGQMRASMKAALFNTLERACLWVRQEFPGMMQLRRSPDDDPKIARIWL